jgi:hypothetical protein
MSICSKTPDSEKSCFNKSKFIAAIQSFDIADLEVLLDWYTMYEGGVFNDQIEVIKNQLQFRNSGLGKELF